MNRCAKGKRVERLIVNWLKSHGVSSARRTQQYCGASEGETSDIQAHIELPMWHLECKGTKSATVPDCILKEWLAQIKRDCPEGKIAVILHKPNGRDVRALMRLADYSKVCSCDTDKIINGDNLIFMSGECWLSEVAGFKFVEAVPA